MRYADEAMEIEVTVPEPFYRGRIVMDRVGAWIQVTVREGNAKRARRLYFAEDAGKDLFRLLDELNHPDTLPVWERGGYISGYEPMSEDQETPAEDSPTTETEAPAFTPPTTEEIDAHFRYECESDAEREQGLDTVANYLRVCANAFVQLCPADERLEKALAALMEARSAYIAPGE